MTLQMRLLEIIHLQNVLRSNIEKRIKDKGGVWLV